MKLFAHVFAAAALSIIFVGCSPVNPETNMNSGPRTGIIGGTNVTPGSQLNQSIVGIYNPKAKYICTGSLLEDNIVLTAAHCVDLKNSAPEDHYILFTHDMNKEVAAQKREEYWTEVTRRGTTIVPNPRWGTKPTKQNSSTGDTALIKFKGTIPAGFKPAKILQSPQLLQEVGTPIVIAGFGVNKNVLVPVNPHTEEHFEEKVRDGKVFCIKAKDESTPKCYKDDMSGSGLLRTTRLKVAGSANSTEIALEQKDGQAACSGDSGGPAYVFLNGEYQLWGVASRVVGLGNDAGRTGPICGGYVIYSDVTSEILSDWLQTAKAQLEKE